MLGFLFSGWPRDWCWPGHVHTACVGEDPSFQSKLLVDCEDSFVIEEKCRGLIVQVHTSKMSGTVLYSTVSTAVFWHRNPLGVSNSCICVLYWVCCFQAGLEIGALSTVAHLWHNGDSSCWLHQFDRHVEVIVQDMVFVRVFRLWYLFFASRERLDILRQQRSTARTHLVEDELEGASASKRSSVAIQRWFTQRSYFGKTSFLWKCVAVAFAVDVLILNLVLLVPQIDNPREGAAYDGVYYYSYARTCTFGQGWYL